MKNLLYCMLVFSIALTQACKKKKESEPETIETPSTTTNPTIISSAEHAQLKIGNYWIYQRVDVDPQGNESPTSNYDSCYISNDTIIHGSTYFQFKNFSIFTYQNFLRDSSNHIINSHGEIIFAADDFTTIFATPYVVDQNPNDTVYTSIYKMVDKDVYATVPAGTFVTSNFQKKYAIFPNYAQGIPFRIANTRFSKNVGMITQTQQIFLSVTSTVERKLARYHLN